MIKNITLFFTTILPLLISAQTNNKKWDLKECIDYAIEHNISVKQADIQARIASLQLQQARLNKLPTANFSTGIGGQLGTSIDKTTNVYTDAQAIYQNFQFSGSMQLYNFGRLKYSVASQTFNVQAALQDIAKVSNDASLNIATYYLQVLSAKEQIKISETEINQTQEQISATEKKVEAGSLPELNLAEMQAQLATDSSNLVGAKTNYDQSLLMLKGILNLDATLPLEIEEPIVSSIPIEPIGSLMPEPLYLIALNNQPTQIGNEFRIKAAEKNVLASKAALYPSLGLGLNLSSNFYNSLKQYNGYTITGASPTGAYVVDKNGNQLSVLSPDYTLLQSQRSFSQLWEGWGDQIKNNFGQGIGLSVTVPIFNNGQARIEYEQSKLSLKNAALQKEQANLRLKQDIYTAYTNAINALQKLEAGKKSEETSEKAYTYALKRYQNGLLATIDLLTNQNNLLRARMQQVANEFDYVFKMKLLEFYKGQGFKF